MPKRTPLECTPENCGDLFAKCGTSNTYATYRCRCDSCTAALREYARQYRAKNLDRVRANAQRHYQKNREETLTRVKQYRIDNIDAIREYDRERSKTEHRREQDREDYRRNGEKIRERVRQYRINNPEKKKEAARRYRVENRERDRDKTVNRRARLYGAWVEDVQRAVVFDRDDWICQECGIECDPAAVYPAKNFATLDHIIPLDAGVFRGGFHSYANCQTLCLSCNSRKGARIS